MAKGQAQQKCDNVTPTFEVCVLGVPRSVGWKGNAIVVRPRSAAEVDEAVFDAVRENAVLGPRLERIARTWGSVEFRVATERANKKECALGHARSVRAWYASEERSERVRVVLVRRRAAGSIGARENLWLDQERSDNDTLRRWKTEMEAHLSELFGADAKGVGAQEYCFDEGDRRGRVPKLRLRGRVPLGWQHPVEFEVMRTISDKEGGSSASLDGGVLMRARGAIARHEAGTPAPSDAEVEREAALRRKFIRLGPDAYAVPQNAHDSGVNANFEGYACGFTSKEVAAWLRKHEAVCACGCARCATSRALPPWETAQARSQAEGGSHEDAAKAWVNQVYETETGVAHVSFRRAGDCACPL